MSDDWRNELASEQQKEKLRFFGCTWDDGITAGQSEDALVECARQFPDAEADYQKSQPATEMQKEKLRFFGCIWNGDITVGKASDALEECERQFPDREAMWQLQKRKWVKIPGTFPVKEFDQLDKTSSPEVTIQKAETTARPPSVRREGFFCGEENAFVADLERDALHERLEKRQSSSDKTASEEVTIQEAAKAQISSPREVIPERPKDFRQPYEMFCPTCDGQIEVPSGTVGKKRDCPHCQNEVTPVFFKKKSATDFKPVAHFGEWVDRLFARNQTCLGGHWLSIGPLRYHFAALTIGISRQIADSIESKGYCVEPDARFGSGTYDRNQTLAIFKPLDGDPIQPSTAYLGAANLLRLCVLITTADGKIDLVELEVFRRAIENQPGLTLTDHKRLLILEQLLAQELCSAAKTAAKIAKSVSADKRLVIGKLLVEVAAANNVITFGERRALEGIFSAFEIPPDTLEKLISQICPSQWDSFQGDVLDRDKWHWNHWRTSHPGVVIDDTTLVGKTWNFTDWKALNARWRDLHERVKERQNQSGKTSTQEVRIQEVGKGASLPATIAGQLDGKAVEHDWRNDPATEKQKEELRAFGCKFDENITAGIAKILIERVFIPQEARGKAISTFQVSVRLRNILENEGFSILGDIHGISYAEFRKFRNCGKKTVEELRELVSMIQRAQPIGHVDGISQDFSEPFVALVGDCLTVPASVQDLNFCDLPVSVRLGNILTERKATRLGDLKGVSLSELKIIKNCGKSTISEIVNLIEKAVAGEFNTITDVNIVLSPSDLASFLDTLISEFSAREVEILNLRLSGEKDKTPTLEDVAAKFSVSRERIRQVVKKITVQLRKAGSRRLNAYLQYIEKTCREMDCPLTPKLFEQWLGEKAQLLRFSPGFYSRLLCELNPVCCCVSSEASPERVAALAPRIFALDMERVYQITNETKDVVAILSVVMADEPEESIKLPTKITMPVPETPKVSSGSKDAPQPTRFNELDAAFHPILERLLTRDSWPVDDFDALAREFNFMPGKICETINEWSDEALGEFILDGDDPVAIHRELIAKETIYG